MTYTLTTAASPTLQDARNGPHKETYLIGYPLRRTYAPFLHNTLTRAAGVPRKYHKVEDQDGVSRFLELVRRDDFGGAAVTIDESEVAAVVRGFTESPIPGFEPTIVHVRTPEQAKDLEAVDLAKIFKSNGWNVVTGDQAMIWQGIEQQKIWLNCAEEELPVQEVVAQVTQQVIQDSATGSEPPLQ
ncbi:hypothetical protein QFC19_004815 [Naganishia cerealis]|uniref:Uncharacterized protein n=1 Tax=Naganishia cerealis TaxID=610337 RepID=A0ACC2VSV3_9TREE|nr:hypothetical protein QFC19_004815 [Naganishia cerealis]